MIAFGRLRAYVPARQSGIAFIVVFERLDLVIFALTGCIADPAKPLDQQRSKRPSPVVPRDGAHV